jgi:hypothetical protein
MTPSMIRSMFVALGAVALVASIASPARADRDDSRHGGEHRERWHEHEWREWCGGHPGAYAYPGYYCPAYAPPPAVIYAPPPPAVIYTPPPAVIYAPPPPRPTLEIEVPIHIR